MEKIEVQIPLHSGSYKAIRQVADGSLKIFDGTGGVILVSHDQAMQILTELFTAFRTELTENQTSSGEGHNSPASVQDLTYAEG